MGPLDLLAPKPAPRFGRAPEINAYVELHNLVAAAESTDEFGRDDLDRISRQHDVDLTVAFPDRRVRIYQEILDDRLADGDLDADDRAVLAHVAHTLALAPSLLRPAHERAFGNAVTSAVSDDCLSVEERLLLYKLQHLLGLDAAIADAAYDVLARERLLKAVARVLCDGRLSPDEAAEVEAIRTDLSLDLPVRIQTMMDGAAERWAKENGDLEPVHVHFDLHGDETAYYTNAGVTWTDVDATNFRKVFASSDYRQLVARGETASLRMPDVALDGPRRRGRVTVTSKRLILLAERRGQQSVNLSSLVEARRFSNGVTARTGGGWHAFFDLGRASGDFHTVLSRLLQDGATEAGGPETGATEPRDGVPRPDGASASARAADAPRVPRPPDGGARWRKVDHHEVRAVQPNTMLGDGVNVQLLDHLEASGWTDSGKARFSREFVVLDGSSRRTVRLSMVATAVRRGRVVWMPLGLAQGWLIEFLNDADAEDFVETVRERTG